jgi:hypothetical protein
MRTRTRRTANMVVPRCVASEATAVPSRKEGMLGMLTCAGRENLGAALPRGPVCASAVRVVAALLDTREVRSTRALLPRTKPADDFRVSPPVAPAKRP